MYFRRQGNPTPSVSSNAQLYKTNRAVDDDAISRTSAHSGDWYDDGVTYAYAGSIRHGRLPLDSTHYSASAGHGTRGQIERRRLQQELQDEFDDDADTSESQNTEIRQNVTNLKFTNGSGAQVPNTPVLHMQEEGDVNV